MNAPGLVQLGQYFPGVIAFGHSGIAAIARPARSEPEPQFGSLGCGLGLGRGWMLGRCACIYLLNPFKIVEIESTLNRGLDDGKVG